MSTEDAPEITLTRVDGGRSARLDLVTFVVVLVGGWALLAWADGRGPGISATGDRPARGIGDWSRGPDDSPAAADRTGSPGEVGPPELAVLGLVRGTRLGGEATAGGREPPLGKHGPHGAGRGTAGRYLVVLHETAPGVYRGQTGLPFAGQAVVGSIELLGERTGAGPSHWYSLASWWARPGARRAAAADERVTLDAVRVDQVGPDQSPGRTAATGLDITVEASALRYAVRMAFTVVSAVDDAADPSTSRKRFVR